MSSISNKYTPSEIESKWSIKWCDDKIGAPTGTGQPYCMMIPPPNVTGTLHMGHGFQLTLMDCIIRYKRMKGYKTLWQVGTDHAGIATQMVVERQLMQQGTDKYKLGRDAFTSKVWEWKERSGSTITQQMRQLGVTVDWDNERFTLDTDFSKAVSHVFVTLFRQNLIYRKEKLINWDPHLQTAVSDLEVINKDHNGHLWTIQYHGDNGEKVAVSTTRPETLFGDMAIAVHPSDERYKDMVGQKVTVPLTDRKIPIIADHHVDPSFGTGAVKVTPAHDFNDEAIALRHGLAYLNILNADATLNTSTPDEFHGLDRFVARKKLINALTENNDLVDTQPHKLQLPTGDRSGVVLEPFLTDQWYMHMSKMAEDALKAVPEKCKLHPGNWQNTYNHWLENIQDWCISRQLWWGHQIPAWYDDKGNIYVGHSLEDVKQHYNLDSTSHLKQDEDVLDTWFSSALWPMVTLGWPDKNIRFDSFYPTQLLVTGFDILFFWVARMIMLQQHFTGEVPFKDVYITGLIRDAQGQKMSKSKGNTLDPLDIINGIDLESLIQKRTNGLMQPQMKDKITKATKKEFPNGIEAHGTDALRFTFIALASTGRDIRFDMQRLAGYRNFCNKIWNCGRFVEHQLTLNHGVTQPSNWSLIDKWLGHQMNETLKEIDKHISTYRFDLLAQTVYHFFWHTFCDWYVELKKVELKHFSSAHSLGAFVSMLDTSLKIMHPLIPYITEELGTETAKWLNIDRASIAASSYPTSAPCSEQSKSVDQLCDAVVALRTVRSEMNISPKAQVKATLSKQMPEQWLTLLKSMVQLSEIKISAPPADGIIVQHSLDDITLSIDLTAHIDKTSEQERLNNKMRKQQKELDKIRQKINQSHYIEKAPDHIKEQDKVQLNRVEENISRIKHYVALLG